MVKSNANFKRIVTPICYYWNVWKTPNLESIYTWPDGTSFGRQNSMNIFNASGYEVFIQRPDLTPNTKNFNSILAQDFTLDMGILTNSDNDREV